METSIQNLKQKDITYEKREILNANPCVKKRLTKEKN